MEITDQINSFVNEYYKVDRVDRSSFMDISQNNKVVIDILIYSADAWHEWVLRMHAAKKHFKPP